MPRKIAISTDLGQRVVKVPDGLSEPELNDIADQVKGENSFKSAIPSAFSSRAQEISDKYPTPQTFVESVGPKGFLNRLSEGAELYEGLIREPFQGAATGMLPGKDFSAQLYKGVTESIPSEELAPTQSIDTAFAKLPQVLKLASPPYALAGITPGKTAGFAAETIVDPTTLISAMGPLLRGVKFLPQLLRGVEESAPIAQSIPRTLPEIPSGFRGQVPLPVPEPVSSPALTGTTVTPSMYTQFLERMGVAPSVASTAAPLPTPAKLPLVLPERFGSGPRTFTEDLRIRGGLTSPQETIPNINPIADLTEGYQATLPSQLSQQPLRVPPSFTTQRLDTLKSLDPDTAAALGRKSKAIRLPERFGDLPLLPERAESLQGKSIVDLFKRASSEKGAIGSDIGGLTAQQKAAREEIQRRVNEYAKKVNITPEEAMRVAILNPSNFDKEFKGAVFKGRDVPETAFETKVPQKLPTPTTPPPSLPTAFKNSAYTGPIPKKISAYSEAARPPQEWLKDLGPIGEAFQKRFEGQFHDNLTFKGRWNTLADDLLNKTSNADFQKLTLIQEGKLIPDARLAPKAQRLRQIFDDVKATAQQVDPNFIGVEDYWRHTGTKKFYDSLKNKRGLTSYQDWLRKQGHSEGEIQDIVRYVSSRDRIFEYGALKYKRQNLIPAQYLRRDKGVLVDYINGAARHLSEQKHFGKSYEKLDDLITQMPDAQASQLLKRIKQAHIDNSRTSATNFEKLVDNVRTFNILTLLKPTTVLLNYEQRLVNPFLVKGASLKNIAAARFSRLTKKGRNFALEAGTIDHELNDVLSEGLRQNGWAKKYMNSMGYGRAERGNRIVGANLGKQIAQSMFKKAAKKNSFAMSVLEGLGIDPKAALARGSLTNEELIRAAQVVDKDINFYNSTLELPLPLSGGPVKRGVTQFIKPAISQTMLFKRIAKDALQNPYNSGKNLLYGLLAAGTVGLGHKKVTKGLGGEKYNFAEEWKKNPAKALLEIYASGPGLGYLADTAKNVEFGKDAAVSRLAGPSIGTVAEVGQGLGRLGKEALKGRPDWHKGFKSLKKTALKRIPYIPAQMTKRYSE